MPGRIAAGCPNGQSQWVQRPFPQSPLGPKNQARLREPRRPDSPAFDHRDGVKGFQPEAAGLGQLLGGLRFLRAELCGDETRAGGSPEQGQLTEADVLMGFGARGGGARALQ